MASLTSLTLPDSFDTSNVTNMSSMFYNVSSLTLLTLPDSFVINSGTDTYAIFYNIPTAATLNAADARARSLWPGVLGN
jgi:surface protein